jgi:hypothetical protein
LSLPEKAGTKVYYELLQQALDKGTSPSLQELMNGLNDLRMIPYHQLTNPACEKKS